MNLYLVVLLALTLCVGSMVEILNDKPCKIMALISLVLFVLCVAFRSQTVTPDTQGYVESYQLVDFNNMKNGDFNIGFILLICLFKLLKLDVKVFFGFIAIVSYTITYCACISICRDASGEKTSLPNFCKVGSKMIFKPCIFSALFIPYFGMFYGNVAIRASIAIPLVLLSYSFLYIKQYGKYLICIGVAMLFHSSAILGIILFLFDRHTTHKEHIYFVSLIVCVVVWVSHISLFLIRAVPFVMHKLYEWTGIGSFKIYDIYYASSIRGNAFWGKKELFFLLCGFMFISVEWKKNRVFHKVLAVFAGGVFLAFAFEYLMQSFRITDFFLIFFVPCGCICLMQNSSIYRKEWHCVEIFISVIAQLITAMRIVHFV